MYAAWNYTSSNTQKDVVSLTYWINTLQNLNLIDAKIQLNNESNPKLMWFGFNFNDSFTAYQQREYQKELKKLNFEEILNSKKILDN